MARQVQKSFLSSQMIAVFHREGLTSEAHTRLRKRLKKSNLELKMFNNKVVTMGITGTKLDNFKPLLVDNNLYIVSKEAHVKEMLKITDKVPRIHLLGK